ncbi:MAG TPA: NusA N-terminal domain-containing protein, partial [Saprospiraceae bacterium]|nr:NusA N-terminal domain-containing protein [Saprospiraceae bacterium]
MLNLVNVFDEFKSGKSIDRVTMVRVMEDVFRTLIKKKYGSDDNFDVIVNTNTGDLEIWRVREVVHDGEVTDERSQVSLTEANAIDATVGIGDECYEQISINDDFGRRAIMAARQTLVSRIMELEKDEIFRKYSEQVGDVITGEVN